MRVYVQPLQFITVRCQRIEKPLLVKTFCEVQILPLSSDSVQVAQDLAHATIFHQEHALHLLLAKGITPASHPLCHFFGGVERLLVTCKRVHVQVTGHDLVNGVERGPDVHTITQSVKEFLWKCAKVAIFVSRLAFCQLRNHQVAVTLELFVIRTGERERTSGQVMSTGKMAAQFAIGFFPIPQGLSGSIITICGGQVPRIRKSNVGCAQNIGTLRDTTNRFIRSHDNNTVEI